MAIILFTKSYTSPDFALLNRYPDQFVSDKIKQDTDWWKINMDYWYNIAVQQYSYNRRNIVPNYELVKGVLKHSDFYNEPEIQSFTETILKNEKLPAYVKHYSILTPVINDLVGELSKRPDNALVKAFDDDSKSAELQFKTDVCQKLIIDTVKQSVQASAAAQGLKLDDQDDIEKMTQQKAQEYLTSYTSLGERWGARMLEFLKMKLNIKEKSEDAFRDLLISARDLFHIFEDNSPLGFSLEVINPKTFWNLTNQDERYTSDPLDKNRGSYACGTVDIMEFSEIINKFKLTKEEIEHMRDIAQQGYLLSGRKSNLISPVVPGPNSVTYDTYDPLVLQYRQIMEGEMIENKDELHDLLGLTQSAAVYGNKFLVVRSYWNSKKKVGKLTFIDEDDQEQTVLVDENYKSGMHPQQIDLEWGWTNQWYQGVKIGLDIYYVKPLEILDYCPIIGCFYEGKNTTKVASLVDQAKPFQMLYDVSMNKLFRLLEKDMGVVFLTSIRQVPVPKDGDHQDALEVWEAEAREKGIIFIDDSPDNANARSTFNQHQAVDLSRSREIQAYYELAVQMRNECWKLVGISEQRLGESKATETATGINSALTQSYAQTEPLFAQHEYVLNKVYQALLDTAMYVESNKPQSTISFISGEGEHCFVQINGSDLKLMDLGVFVTSRAEDAQNFREFRQLSQAMLQNGATPYDVSVLYATKSMRKMQEIFKDLKDQQDQFKQQEQQNEQQATQQKQQQFEQAQQLAQTQHEKDQTFEGYQRDQDRMSKERVAIITASKATEGASIDQVDPVALSKLDNERTKMDRDYQLKIQELTQKQQQILAQQNATSQTNNLQKQKIDVERHKIDQQVKIAKLNKGKDKKDK